MKGRIEAGRRRDAAHEPNLDRYSTGEGVVQYPPACLPALPPPCRWQLACRQRIRTQGLLVLVQCLVLGWAGPAARVN